MLGNESASILGPYPTVYSKIKSQDSNDMHNSKTSAADDHLEDSASNGIKEETNHPASNIDMAGQQASSSVNANKIGGHIFNDVKETDIAIKKSILTISYKPSRCVVEWVDTGSAPFVCSALNPVVQNNRQNNIRYTFDISNCDEIFDILVLEKRIRIPTDHVISSSKELGNCAYYKWHDSFSHNICDCNVLHQQLQSAIDEGCNHLDTGGHTSHSQILPKGIINLESKKILVQPSQARTTKGKIIIIGEIREKMKPTIKKKKSTFHDLSAKYKKDNDHTKNRQNWKVWKVKPELLVSPRQANVSVAGRHRDSK
jgi:hypothetical protein